MAAALLSLALLAGGGGVAGSSGGGSGFECEYCRCFYNEGSTDAVVPAPKGTNASDHNCEKAICPKTAKYKTSGCGWNYHTKECTALCGYKSKVLNSDCKGSNTPERCEFYPGTSQCEGPLDFGAGYCKGCRECLCQYGDTTGDPPNPYNVIHTFPHLTTKASCKNVCAPSRNFTINCWDDANPGSQKCLDGTCQGPPVKCVVLREEKCRLEPGEKKCTGGSLCGCQFPHWREGVPEPLCYQRAHPRGAPGVPQPRIDADGALILNSPPQ